MSESDDNMFYDDEEEDINSYDDEEDVDLDEFTEEKSITLKKDFEVFNVEELRKRMHADIYEVSSILSVPNEVASLLLLHYKFDVSKLHEAWFANEESVRKDVGLVNGDDDRVVVEKRGKSSCGICFDDYGFNEVKALSCGHNFCRECWKGYISCSISDGPGCLSLKCPMPKCGCAVGEGFVGEFASDAEKEKYRVYMFRSYVEVKKGLKWCPFPDCENAVEVLDESGGYDVTCRCSHSFCWNCAEELHRPVDCETVKQWNLKNADESANTEWILAYTKNCPKCKRSIEKNLGCNHMTCGKPCGHQFCWLCLGDWKHGCYDCNRYKEDKKPVDPDAVIRERAKNVLQRYVHYYERWASNHKSREKARSDLEKMRDSLLKVIGEKNSQDEATLGFITEAWEQIIECRRVLKWTYAYGYYLPEKEETKKMFFEYLQGEAETALERLHRCAESELEDYYLEGRSTSIDFLLFRCKLTGLTKVTANYFENLVTALENGLEDVDSDAEPETQEAKKDYCEENWPSKEKETKTLT